MNAIEVEDLSMLQKENVITPITAAAAAVSSRFR
jgi:hypothetical protein